MSKLNQVKNRFLSCYIWASKISKNSHCQFMHNSYICQVTLCKSHADEDIIQRMIQMRPYLSCQIIVQLCSQGNPNEGFPV